MVLGDIILKRNSSIELLRIMAMFMITVHHYLMCINVTVLPFGINKILTETFLYSGGKIGVVLFFLISAWYLPVTGTIYSNFRRVWLLEREVLFWSLFLLICSVFFYENLSLDMIIRSVFPTATGLWWYITAYSVFLFIFPFLVEGLRILGWRKHLALCCVSFVLWSLAEGFLPVFSLGMPGGSFLSFVYIYILVSFYRWYMPVMKRQTAWKMIVCGYGILLFAAVVGGIVYGQTGVLAHAQVYLSGAEYKLCPLLIGFGIFSLFITCEFHNKIINCLASSMLSVYLITAYPAVHETLWPALAVQDSMWNRWYVLPLVLGTIVAVMLVICALDSVRWLLFHLTIDRHKGKLFDFFYEHLYCLWMILVHQVNKNLVEKK